MTPLNRQTNYRNPRKADQIPAWIADVEARRVELNVSQCSLGRTLGHRFNYYASLLLKAVPPRNWDILKPMVLAAIEHLAKHRE